MAPQNGEDHVDRATEDKDLGRNVFLMQYRLGELDKKLDQLISKIESSYATKAELNGVREDVVGLKNNINWLVKTIIGCVVMAVLGLVVLKGGVRP